MYDSVLDQLEGLDGILLINNPIPNLMFKELPEIEETTISHKQMMELLGAGLSSDDIIDLRKQGVI